MSRRVKWPLPPNLAAAFALAAADDKPGIVVLVFDDGLLVGASSLHPATPAVVVKNSRAVLTLMRKETTAPDTPVTVVAVHPDFGPEKAAAHRSRLAERCAELGYLLSDWLLVDADGGVASVEEGR